MGKLPERKRQHTKFRFFIIYKRTTFALTSSSSLLLLLMTHTTQSTERERENWWQWSEKSRAHKKGMRKCFKIMFNYVANINSRSNYKTLLCAENFLSLFSGFESKKQEIFTRRNFWENKREKGKNNLRKILEKIIKY